MSKMECPCGAKIHDFSDAQAWKGYILKEQDQESFHEGVGEIIKNYFSALSKNERDKWIEQYTPGFDPGLDHHEYLDEVIFTTYLHYFEEIFECDKCGRILIQKDKEWISYQPGKEKYVGVLTSSLCDYK